MAEYEELVKRMRAVTDGSHEDKCDGCPYDEDYPCCVDCLDTMLKQAADAIEKLIEIIQNHDFLESLIKPCWIPVIDHTPEYSGYYLVCDNDDNVYTAYFGNTTKNWWTEKVVTHWMPRPEPPKEEA